MKVEIIGTYSNCVVEGVPLMLNTIAVKRTDGKVVTLDRDESNYSMTNGEADILFRGTYVWDGKDTLYPNPDEIHLYDGAELIDYEIEDDAPEDYDLTLEIGQKISAW